MSRILWAGLLLVAGCSYDAPADQAAPPLEAELTATKASAAPRGAPNAKPRYAQGIVNPLMGAFKRFDGFHLASSLWPELSRFHAQIDQHDASKGFLIGFLVNYLEGAVQGSERGALDAVLFFGSRQDAEKRRWRVATYETVSDPPGPLKLVASSSDDGLTVPASAKLNLRRENERLVVDVIDGNQRYSRSFQRMQDAWALEPGGAVRK